MDGVGRGKVGREETPEHRQREEGEEVGKSHKKILGSVKAPAIDLT